MGSTEQEWDPEVDGDLDVAPPVEPAHRPRVEHQSSFAGHQSPAEVMIRVRQYAPIVLDPATTKDNPTGAQYIRTVDCDPDGLATAWHEFRGLTYVNPPYGRSYNRVWAHKIASEGMLGDEIIALVAARTGSRWWRFMWEATRICFIDHRLKFVGMPSGAPFDSALCYWGSRPRAFRRCMKDLGRVITP